MPITRIDVIDTSRSQRTLQVYVRNGKREETGHTDVLVVANTSSDGISRSDLKIMNEYDILATHRWRVSTDRIDDNIERVSITSIHIEPSSTARKFYRRLSGTAAWHQSVAGSQESISFTIQSRN
jgi:hypothetical protein